MTAGVDRLRGFVMLFGPFGCGKSTVVAGLDTPSFARLSVDEVSINGPNPFTLCRVPGTDALSVSNSLCEHGRGIESARKPEMRAVMRGGLQS